MNARRFPFKLSLFNFRFSTFGVSIFDLKKNTNTMIQLIKNIIRLGNQNVFSSERILRKNKKVAKFLNNYLTSPFSCRPRTLFHFGPNFDPNFGPKSGLYSELHRAFLRKIQIHWLSCDQPEKENSKFIDYWNFEMKIWYSF